MKEIQKRSYEFCSVYLDLDLVVNNVKISASSAIFLKELFHFLIGRIMTRTKLINGIRYNLTAEEEAQRDAEELAWSNEVFDRAMENLRDDRNSRISCNRFLHALSDVTMSPEMETYRQELRDITNGLTTVEDVKAVVFPTNHNITK